MNILSVIPTRNDELMIDRLVNNVLQFADKIIFFENGSIDNTVDKISNHIKDGKPIELIRLHHDFVIWYGFDTLARLMFNYDRNFEWIVRMDSDFTCPDPSGLRNALLNLDEQYEAFLPIMDSPHTSERYPYKSIIRSANGSNKIDAVGYIHQEMHVNGKHVYSSNCKKVDDVFIVQNIREYKSEFLSMFKKTHRAYMHYRYYVDKRLQRGTHPYWLDPEKHDFDKIKQLHDLFRNEYYPKSISKWHEKNPDIDSKLLKI